MEKKSAIEKRIEANKKALSEDNFLLSGFCIDPATVEDMDKINKMEEKKAKMDDTLYLGCSHHNHSKHRVYVDGLTFEEASVLEGEINKLIKTASGTKSCREWCKNN